MPKKSADMNLEATVPQKKSSGEIVSDEEIVERRNQLKKGIALAEKALKARELPSGMTPNSCYMLGVQASSSGIGKHRNPFTNDSEAYEHWRMGWEGKFYGEL